MYKIVKGEIYEICIKYVGSRQVLQILKIHLCVRVDMGINYGCNNSVLPVTGGDFLFYVCRKSF
jgi:hypothetical protein